MAQNGIFQANLPILDGKNWDRWFRQMRVIFVVHDGMTKTTNSMEPLPTLGCKEEREQGSISYSSMC